MTKHYLFKGYLGRKKGLPCFYYYSWLPSLTPLYECFLFGICILWMQSRWKSREKENVFLCSSQLQFHNVVTVQLNVRTSNVNTYSTREADSFSYYHSQLCHGEVVNRDWARHIYCTHSGAAPHDRSFMLSAIELFQNQWVAQLHAENAKGGRGRALLTVLLLILQTATGTWTNNPVTTLLLWPLDHSAPLTSFSGLLFQLISSQC